MCLLASPSQRFPTLSFAFHHVLSVSGWKQELVQGWSIPMFPHPMTSMLCSPGPLATCNRDFIFSLANGAMSCPTGPSRKGSSRNILMSPEQLPSHSQKEQSNKGGPNKAVS